MTRRKHGCLWTFIIIFLVLVLIVTFVGIFLFNSTPNEIGLGKINLSKKYTIDSVGFGDFTIKQLWNFKDSLLANSKAPTFDYAPDSQDKLSADAIAEHWLLEKSANDKILYKNLLTRLTPVATTSLEAQTLTQKQLCYIFDTVLKQFYASNEGELLSEIVSAIDVLKTLNASVTEMYFHREADGDYLRITVHVEYGTYLEGVNIPFFKLADNGYVSLDSKIEVVDTILLKGVLSEKKFETVSINNSDKTISHAALDALFKLIAEDDEEPLTTESISGYVYTVLSYLTGKIGKIGTSLSSGIDGIDFEKGTISFQPVSIL